MRRYIYISFLFFSLFFLCAPYEYDYCGHNVMCHIDDRSYYARLPKSWDGKTPMPVLLHFHGWGRQGRLIVNHRRIVSATRPRGVLLLAPNGRGRTWDFWDTENEDVDFAVSVIRDAARRWSIDESRIFISGYSYGSSMAWRFACSRGDLVHSLLAISGYIDGRDERCNYPVNVRHIHGTRDTVLHFRFSPEGGVDGLVNLWLERNDCPTQPSRITQWSTIKQLPINRHHWENCSTDKTILLDVHSRGHFIPRRWFARQLDELL